MSIPNAKWIAAGKQVILKSDFTDIEDGIFSLIHGHLPDLIVKNNAVTPDTKIDISALNAWLLDGSDVPFFVDAPDYTIDATDVGVVNGTRAALGASTWYYFYIISNGVTSGGWCDTSPSAPSFPAGYVYFRLVGAIKTDSSSHFLNFLKKDDETSLIKQSGVGLPIMATGAAGNVSTPTWVAVDTTAFVPATAKKIKFITASGNAVVIAAPNNNYGGGLDATHSPPVICYTPSAVVACYIAGTFMLESSNIYWASQDGSGRLWCAGWIE